MSWLKRNTSIRHGRNAFNAVGRMTPLLSQIVHKDRVGETERRKELDQISLCIRLGLLEDAIFQRALEDLLFGNLAHLCFKVGVRFAQDRSEERRVGKECR